MSYIKRDIESKIISLTKEYPCILITGPRQVGKNDCAASSDGFRSELCNFG